MQSLTFKLILSQLDGALQSAINQKLFHFQNEFNFHFYYFSDLKLISSYLKMTERQRVSTVLNECKVIIFCFLDIQ